VAQADPRGSRELRVLLGAFTVLCLGVALLAGRQLERPGLYYDEVIQAVPAAEFLREGGKPLQLPGALDRWLFGGWFPLMTQPYMGALKSQLLIPVFAAFGASTETLRITTLAWGCLGLGLLMLWVYELFGLPTALLCGVLLAFDPSFLFVCRHDWGSVALALVCRGGGLWLLTRGWRRASLAQLGAGGLLLGLGVYNKIDFVPFLAGSGLALAVLAPAAGWRRLRTAPRRGLAVATGLLVGAAPMLAGVGGVLAASRAIYGSVGSGHGELAEKLATWLTMLDGSYFLRLMQAGGSFERLAQTDAPSSPFPILCLASAGWLAFDLRRGRRGGLDRQRAFVLLAGLLTALLLLATPRAARIHHTLNVVPFPQLLVALAVGGLWRTGGSGRRRLAVRGLAVLGCLAALTGSLRIDLAVLESLERSGGRGRWSDALTVFAEELPTDAEVVSLDWGFQLPLRFLRPELRLEEPVWRLAAAGMGSLHGDSDRLYLVQDPAYAVFPLGGALIEALDALPMGTVVVREHRDREGGVAFRSIRFARPHELVYRGSFEVRLR